MNIKFVALETETVRALQRGGQDANQQIPQRAISDGGAIPCRHCLSPVAKGEEYLILSHRPFPRAQPYAESGPIFLHARECERAADTHDAAPMFTYGRAFILRGYRNNDWINYDAAEVVTPDKIEQTAKRLLERDDVAYVHMRSSQMNCYQCRIERA
ncbi:MULTISPECIES: DUF1203 domain-containing protein [Hoeflea]|jgi:hypothetical protein|uniref:DUF1203 domain-containing protein n=1 Tax=Hoeflea alexandrii TaxID=288436 RepID=A0ABT1CPK7_9HYPH|nr:MULTISPECIES: DUF1203 domain-containing protein [Hoeflea]MBV6651879.1 DUF1203 domain-containing protein [Hoeflea sp.]MCO6408058.1 DUF1203 domain-containing protein [Hoeflea alexandrii]VVT12355.1 conserved hypothetical protein [Hoeflea sp. EC-HK425]|tara:strand:+ start:152 stop:622 length:471 start_codon:yes stop_codon:yes gene_type:complete